MPDDNNHKIFSAADIERYHKGLMTAAERNELEKAALDDPFLADALEGYGTTPVNSSIDLAELNRKLEERVSGASVVRMVPAPAFGWWKVAAAVLLVSGASLLVYKFGINNQNRETAKVEQRPIPQQQVPAAMVPADSNLAATTKEKSKTPDISKKPEASGGQASEVAASMPRKNTGKKYPAIGNANSSQVNTVASATSQPTQIEPAKTFDTFKAMVNTNPARMDTSGWTDITSPSASAVYQKNVSNYFRGRILDANNNPLPFANITNTRDNVGTYADAKGFFTLLSPDSVLNVQVRSIGFLNASTQLKNGINNNVVLKEDAKEGVVLNTTTDKLSRAKRSNDDNVKFEESEPADGWSNYNTYLANNINLPTEVKTRRTIGQVELSFDVTADGKPVNIKVEKSLCKECDEEAVRLVKQGPKWKKKGNSKVTIKVPFQQ